MSKRLILVFAQLGRFPPKLYKRKSIAQKLIEKEQSYKYKQYENEFAASNAFIIHQMEHKKYLLNQQQLLLENKIKNLNSNINIQNTNNINANYQNDQNEKENIQKASNDKIQQLKTTQVQTTETKSKSKFIEQNSKQQTNSSPKITQLQQIKQSLYHISPSMEKLLTYYTPTLTKKTINPISTYTAFFDGCSKFNPGPSGVGYYIMDKQETILEACWPLGVKTNNQAQFTALLYLLADAYINKIKSISIYGDSKLAIQFSLGRMKVTHPNLIDYAQAVQKMLKFFPSKQLQFVQRKYNSTADKLSNLALKKKPDTQKVTEPIKTQTEAIEKTQ